MIIMIVNDGNDNDDNKSLYTDTEYHGVAVSWRVFHFMLVLLLAFFTKAINRVDVYDNEEHSSLPHCSTKV
jgi:hypothetical protein